MKFLGSAFCLLAFLTASCELTGENTITENPSCITFTTTFSDYGDVYHCEETIPNIISNDYTLKSITITDADGWGAESITLHAPADNEGQQCPFLYPNVQNGYIYGGNSFEQSNQGGACIYTAENTYHSVTSGNTNVNYHVTYCPVENHMGNWVLEIEYPKSVSTERWFEKELQICFEYEE